MHRAVAATVTLLTFACGGETGPAPQYQPGAAADGQLAAAGAGAPTPQASPQDVVDDESVGDPCSPPQVDASGPAVSLRVDVMPVLGLACANGPCHGGSAPAAGLYLGPRCRYDADSGGCLFAQPGAAALDGQEPLTDADVARMLDNAVDAPSATAPAVLRIAPGMPDASFLVHKLTQTHDRVDNGACENQTTGGDDCGQAMPPGNGMCSQSGGAARIERIARWIAQGALDN